MAGISGLAARIKLTAQTATTDASEATTLVPGTTSAYQINDLTKRHLDRTVVPVIKDGAGVVPSSDLSINYVTGTVTMSTSATAAVTFTDFSFLTSSYLVGGRSWTVNTSADVHETTTFSTDATDPKWKAHQASFQEATVDIERLVPAPSTAQPTFFDLLNTEAKFVVELYPSLAVGDRYEAYAFVSDYSRNVSMTDMQTDGITLRVDGALSYTTST